MTQRFALSKADEQTTSARKLATKTNNLHSVALNQARRKITNVNLKDGNMRLRRSMSIRRRLQQTSQCGTVLRRRSSV